MLATILKSPRATQTTMAIIDSFTKLRELTRNIEAIHNEPDNAKQKGLIQRTGELLSDLLVDDRAVERKPVESFMLKKVTISLF